MHAHQRGLRAFQVAAYQSNVLVMIDVACVCDHPEVTEPRGQDGFGHAPDVAFMLHAIANEIRDREHLQVVFLAKFDELRHAGHEAAMAHDFADDACGSNAAYTRYIHG